jgi:hypothetical protein
MSEMQPGQSPDNHRESIIALFDLAIRCKHLTIKCNRLFFLHCNHFFPPLGGKKIEQLSERVGVAKSSTGDQGKFHAQQTYRPTRRAHRALARALEQTYWAYLFVSGSYSHSGFQAMLALMREFEAVLGRPPGGAQPGGDRRDRAADR